MSETTFLVKGMTCGHCVASVTEELQEIDSVEAVDVVLETGQVTITSAGPISDEQIRAAVAEAGYELG